LTEIPVLPIQSEREHTDQDDNRMLSFADWCKFNGFSPSTGRRLLLAGEGPVVTRLSTRRIGISYAANRAWQKSRSRASE
jgi:hypothetical protein